jgi:23S rRNA (uracil1939-C5)-methyltransferase
MSWPYIRDDVEKLDSKRFALDLFCGIGNFSIPLTDYFDKVIGVESSPSAIEWAKKNSDQVEWRQGDAKSELSKLVTEKKFFDLVLLDPPRQGAYDEVQILSQFFSPCVIYISCNIETLIRDLVYLTKRAKYKISSWATVDLFPQTHHIESIVILRL